MVYNIPKSGLRALTMLFMVLAVVLLSAYASALDAPEVQASIVHNEVHLNWNAVDGAEMYNVYWSRDNSTFELLGNTTGNSYVVDLTGNDTGRYYFKVEAVNGTLTNSTVVSVKFYPPVAPGNVTASYGGGRVYLSWSEVNGSNGYYIFRGENESDLKFLISVSGTDYTDTKIVAGRTYYYGIRAYNSTGESDLSYVVRVDVPSAASGSVAISNGEFWISFNTALLLIGVSLFTSGIPIFFYGRSSHRDIAAFAVLIGFVSLLLSYALAAHGIQAASVTVAGLALNVLLLYVGSAFLLIGIVLAVIGSLSRSMRSHLDVAAFSIVFGVVTLLMSHVVNYIMA